LWWERRIPPFITPSFPRGLLLKKKVVAPQGFSPPRKEDLPPNKKGGNPQGGNPPPLIGAKGRVSRRRDHHKVSGRIRTPKRGKSTKGVFSQRSQKSPGPRKSPKIEERAPRESQPGNPVKMEISKSCKKDSQVPPDKRFTPILT